MIFISEKGKFLSQYAVIKVFHCIRDVILKTGRLFIDMESHFVNDHFHIVQCFKCQGIGHKSGSKYCPLYDKASTICLYCSGDHKSIHCKWKTDENKYQCANCKNSRFTEIRRQAGHTANSMHCPLVQKQLTQIKNNILTEPKNSQKVQSHLYW